MHSDLSNTSQQGFQAEHPALVRSEDYLRSGNPNAAVSELRKALQQAPQDWRLYSSLGDALLAAGREEEAIGALMLAFHYQPKLASACVKIGRAFFSRNLSDPALFWLRRALDIDASSDDCLISLAVAESRFGSRERVADLLSSWVAKNPDDPVRRHLATAVLGNAAPTKAPVEYVKTLFDGYAERFDESLAKLHYCGPQLIADAIADWGFHPLEGGNVLDLGCGTGLVGEVVRPIASYLVGVDLSEEMLEIASGRNLYDELCRAEMNAYMQSQPNRFSMVVAADVLTYCGELEEFSSAVETTLCPGGRLVVVLEALEDSSETNGYHLNRSGRFSHHESYLKDCFLRHGLAVRTVSHKPMRHNLGRPVPTLLVSAEKRNSG